MTTRVRRQPEEARRLILDAAEALLVEGGPAAVQVRAVAAKVGVTDAAVSHHFGRRDDLLGALLRRCGRQVRDEVRRVVAAWSSDDAGVVALVDALADIYASGYGELALALHVSGWRDRGSGMLDGVVEALHARRSGPPRPRRRDTQLAVAALHQAMLIEPLFGSALRRSAGLTGPDATDDGAQRRWWVDTVCSRLGLERG